MRDNVHARGDTISFFFFNATAPPEIYTLPLHAALPISGRRSWRPPPGLPSRARAPAGPATARSPRSGSAGRSEEHTSELQSPDHLVCRLLLEKKKTNRHTSPTSHLRPPPAHPPAF